MTDQIFSASVLEGIEFDEGGYMVDAYAWSPDLAEALAAQMNITLTDRHWIVINYARAEFEANGEAPTLRRITKETDVNTKELYQLFPGGAAKVAARIAGLAKPTGCI